MSNQQNIAKTFCGSIGLLTATGAETVYDTTLVIHYCINGIGYRKAAVTDGTTPTTDGNSGDTFALADDKGTCYVWALNSAGTVSVFAGSTEDLDSSGAFKTLPDFPAIDLDTYCPFAITTVKNTSGSNFAFGTTNWNTSNVDVDIQNVLVMPGRPQNP